MNRKIYNLVDEDGKIFDSGVLWELENKHGFKHGYLIRYHNYGCKIKGLYYVRETGKTNPEFKAKRKEGTTKDVTNTLPKKEEYTMPNGQRVTLIHNFKGELMKTTFHPIQV
jgi:hypothetical protein